MTGKLMFKFKFKLCYNRRSVGQFILVSFPFWGTWPDFNFLRLTISSSCRALWREDGSIICSAITHCLESRRTHNHILVSHLRLPQPGGQGPRIYIPHELSGPVITSGTGFPFRRLLRPAELQWRYSNPYSSFGSSQFWDNVKKSKSKPNYITTDSQSASPFWCQAPIWGGLGRFNVLLLFW
jgi:hypothetical protein